MFEKMQWFNAPAADKLQDDHLTVTTAPKSDFWRKTHYGFIRDSGHFFYREVRGDFEVRLRVNGQYRELYDQAGLMLRVDEENWIKTGIEFFDNHQHASAVVTRDFSDWSVVRLPGGPASLWLRITRKAEAVEIFYSLDGQEYTLLRLAYLVPAVVTQVGPMCASPDGSGFETVFEEFTVQPLG
jgi:regulation of enolase protein 1 (concanavalin A-like superfamily)